MDPGGHVRMFLLPLQYTTTHSLQYTTTPPHYYGVTDGIITCVLV